MRHQCAIAIAIAIAENVPQIQLTIHLVAFDRAVRKCKHRKAPVEIQLAK